MNPFTTEFQTPFRVPPFDKIKFEHFEPAFTQGFATQVEQYVAIEENPERPSFENTLEALERSGAMARRVSRVFYSLLGTDSTPEMNELAKEVGSKIAANKNRLYLSRKLFERVRYVKEQD